MLEIGLGVALFTAIVLALVLVILLARSRLVATGVADVTVNTTRKLKIPVGEKLLTALSSAGINLPSTCGGVGTCGLCRVKVLAGGGAIMATETVHITKREAGEGARLACQVTVKQALDVEVPEAVFGAREWQCTVRSSMNISTLIKEVVLDLAPGDTIDFRAGSYVQIVSPPYQARFADFEIDEAFEEEWKRLGLRKYQAAAAQPESRAYSMANSPADKTSIVLDVRIAIPPPGASDTVPPGIVSSYIFSLKPGDKVAAIGPFGHFFAKDTDNEMVFVGGGVGMAPLRSHIFHQLVELKSKRKMTFWFGARNRREILYRRDFDELQAKYDNFRWFIVLSEPQPEDDWKGMTGFVHQALLAHYLEDHPAPEDCEYYVCGPPVMLRAVRNMLDSLGVDPDNILFDDVGG
jgi:Na+-transporting NADH:ubiquinone oxidoreductase subunit F